VGKQESTFGTRASPVMITPLIQNPPGLSYALTCRVVIFGTLAPPPTIKPLIQNTPCSHLPCGDLWNPSAASNYETLIQNTPCSHLPCGDLWNPSAASNYKNPNTKHAMLSPAAW
jgi:hypothetical protein